MNVSVIIPAHNAASTLAETLESLRVQTFTSWEAIVVDDGSSDGTAAIAVNYGEKDSRIRTVSQQKMGVGTARNTGIRLARFDWLLFLDADDWLSPQHLERMTGALAVDANLDAVYCAWVRVAPDGNRLYEGFCSQEGDLFNLFAITCPFSIHACVIRRSIIVSLGGFDTSLVTCEDWDLWQRIARTGARFGAVREVLSFYRMRLGSASTNGFRLFTDSLLVIGRGHSSDSRVPNPRTENANGLSVTQLPTAMFNQMCYCAGIFLGLNKDARPLLSELNNIHDALIDPEGIAVRIFNSSLIHACQPKNVCDKFWPNIEQRVEEFLFALEKQSQTIGLVRRTNAALQRLILNNSASKRPLTIGTLHAVRIEVTEPICDIIPPSQAERLDCNVELEGAHIGVIELPVFDGIVPGYVLADALEADYLFWKIIGWFFEHTVYRDLKVKKDQKGLSLWRGSLCLANNLLENESIFWSQVHEQCGWTMFLQEIWGRPDWPTGRFYDPGVIDGSVVKQLAHDNWITIEVSEDIPDVEVSGRELNVLVTVGGTALAVVILPVNGNIAHAQGIRAALTDACGLELCRAAVREGLLGKTLNDKPATLRARLAAAAAAARQGNAKGSVFERHSFIPGTTDVLGRVVSPGEHAIVFGRRAYGEMGTSISRRAMLPAAVAPDLIEAATIAGEPVIQIPEPCTNPSRVAYVPELIVCSSSHDQEAVVGENNSEVDNSCDTTVCGRDYFEKIFAARIDPWKYTSPYEQKKYEQTLEMLPPERIGRALELACAEGHFTVKLATRIDHLIAADISQTALGRASKRCANMKNIRFVQLDLTKDPLPGCFELIVCSEMLYYVGGQEALKSIARKLAKAIEPWGYLLMAHAHVVVDEPDKTGFDWDVPFGAKVIGDTFTSIRNLRLVKELRTPLYRIQLFQRVSSIYSFLYKDNSTPAIFELTQQPTELLPEVAVHVKWRDRSKEENAHQAVIARAVKFIVSHDSYMEENAHQAVVTDRLPILMYHRVSPTGLPETSRYRVTPESFEEQLRYLRVAGYYSVSIEDWHVAMEKKRPLPGRAVVFTFDDGYSDFLTYAWPLLKRYGFSATVFIVADCVGRTNSWDSVYGEEIPLLGWEDIRLLQDEGVEFGSHSVRHPFLTAFSAEEIVREGARSRSILGRKLGKMVKAFAYPYGDVDRVVQHCIGACGYIFGLTTRGDLSKFYDPLLALPRIEVCGSDRIKDFIKKLVVC